MSTPTFFSEESPFVQHSLLTPERFGNDETYINIKRAFDAQRNILTENFALVSPEKTRHYLLRYHLYILQEIHILLKNAGFEIIHTYGDYHATPLTDESPNMLLVSKRAG